VISFTHGYIGVNNNKSTLIVDKLVYIANKAQNKNKVELVANNNKGKEHCYLVLKFTYIHRRGDNYHGQSHMHSNMKKVKKKITFVLISDTYWNSTLIIKKEVKT